MLKSKPETTNMMRKLTIEQKIILTLGLIFLVLPFGAFVSAQTQTVPRERIVQLSPTPKQTPTPKPKQTPTPKPTPTPKFSPTPTPTPFPTPTPTSIQTQTLPELQGKMRSVLLRPQFARAQIGIKVISLDTGKVLFEENAEKYFMPASNMKNFTVAAALDRLSPNFRFVTSVYAPVMPDESGTIRGDLIIYGRGDPSISTAFNDKDYFKGMEALANKIVAAGVKRVEGNLIGDDSYFSGGVNPPTWEWDDLQWYFGAEISALTVNDNALDVFIRPGISVGSPAFVQILPGPYGMILINKVVTGSASTKREIGINRKLGSNVIEITGVMPINQKEYTNYVAVQRPAFVFVSMLRQLLTQKGVIVTGQTNAVDAEMHQTMPLPPNLVEVTRLESPPLSVIAGKTMKPSQNLYTELILRALGEAMGDKAKPNWTSIDRGIDVVDKFLPQAGISAGSVRMYDGCGLSRHNLITPNAAAQLYYYMSKHRYAQVWQDSLTIAGVDGTLENRFKGTLGAGNVRGKTGTIDQVGTLSGYLTTASGERLAFSVLVNNLPGGGSGPRNVIDELVILLVNFNGRSQ